MSGVSPVNQVVREGQGRSFQKRTLKLNVERYQVKVEGEVVASHVKRTASIKAKR